MARYTPLDTRFCILLGETEWHARLVVDVITPARRKILCPATDLLFLALCSSVWVVTEGWSKKERHGGEALATPSGIPGCIIILLLL